MRDARFVAWALLLLLAAAVAVWYLRGPGPAAPEAPVAREPAPATVAEPEGPRFPLPAEPATERPALRPLPDLDDSDQYFRLELAGLLGDDAVASLVGSALIEKLVATVDNLPRQHVAERLRPVAAPDTPFAVAGQDGSGEFALTDDNYRRYDAMIARFAAADLGRAAELYRRYYPLFQKAYVGLGYPDGYFNDRLVEVIDHLLATPDVQEPVVLVRPHVMYQFADDDLEAMSAGRKLLVRIGPAHRAQIKQTLRDFRALIVSDAPVS